MATSTAASHNPFAVPRMLAPLLLCDRYDKTWTPDDDDDDVN
jgi:hypothetical protein